MADTDRVLFVDQSGAMGGAELSLLDIVKRRLSNGHDVDTVALLSYGPFAERLIEARVRCEVMALGVDVQKTSGLAKQLLSGPRVLSVAFRLAKLARSHDLLYANTQKAAVVGAVAAKLSGRPLIWHLRDMLDASHFSRANRRVVVTLTNLAASRVIANSQATADAYRQAGGRVETVVVHNGVDPSPFDSIPVTDAASVRAELGIPPEAKLAGVFGRLTPWKGQHVFLEALESDRLQEVHAAIVGEALFTDEDRHYADQLKERCRTGALAGRVHWLGQRSDIPQLMRACDVIVHSSTEPEPFGRVIVEGMFASRPVIAAQAGGAVEIVQNGENGLLTAPGDASALAEALARLIDDPDFARRIAASGRATAETRFGLEDRVTELNQIIAETVAKR